MRTSTSELLDILQISNRDFTISDDSIELISVDSRNVSLPEKTLFVALEGTKTSGSDYVNNLYRTGVRHFLVSNKHKDKFKELKANLYYVEDTLGALQRLIQHKRKQYTLPVIGITGSNGKTIVKEWLSLILQKKYSISKSPKSYNSQVGVPLSLWGLNHHHTLGIYEAGISMPNEMVHLEKMICPQIGIFTHLGDAHQSNFKSKEEKLEEKLRLFVNSEVLIVKYSLVEEYNYAFENLKSQNRRLKLKTWGDTDKSDIQIKLSDDKKYLNVHYLDQQSRVKLTNVDSAFVENICHCIAAVLTLNEKLEDYITQLEELSPIEMRLELIEGINNTTIINDTYNADIDSLMIATQFLFQQTPHLPKAIILSEILETGEQPLDEIMALLHSKKLNQLILIGHSYTPFIAQFQKLTIEKVSHYESTEAFIKYYAHGSLRNHTILVKGARKYHLEDIVQLYRKKTHSTYLKVHLNALKNNLTEFTKLIMPETKIMIMLKAHGYGLGSVEIAKLFENERVNYFAVAYTDEGIELRNAGVQKPIMVMNPEVTALDKMIDYHLEPEIYSLDILNKMIESVERNAYYRESPISIHLKIETGMHRLGIVESDIPMVLDLLKRNSNIQVKTIFSHLSGSDEAEFDGFTSMQITLFQNLSSQIEARLGYRTIKHILNTGGIIRHSRHQMDMVRLGIGLFGFESSNELQGKLQNTISLISKITQIKHLKAGESTGYSRKGMVSRESKIGIINIGYADGYLRALGNGRAQVYIKGQYAPTLGNICMDMTMVDLTDMQGVEEGDEVELIGPHILASDLAKKMNTIPYEILTSISSRVQRLYWED